MADEKIKDVTAEPEQAAPTAVIDTTTTTTTHATAPPPETTATTTTDKEAKTSPELGPGTTTSSAAASTRSAKRPEPLKVDNSRPEDFEGEINTNSRLPSAEDLAKVEDYYVLDRNGKTHRFKELYSGKNVARRVLVIFVRHFFCGNCQLYIQELSEQITPESLLRLPISTFIAVVGCGDPKLIDMYAKQTNCRFPIYTDPERRIFDALGMISTLSLGPRPAYARKSLPKVILESMALGLTKLHNGMAFKGGPSKQVGGEFLFEPLDVASPIGMPERRRKSKKSIIKGDGDDKKDDAGDRQAEEEDQEEGDEEEEEDAIGEPKRVTWCHRMRTTRDHVEVPELKDVLGLAKLDQGAPLERKGTGTTMADQMSQMSGMNGRVQSPTTE